jgi:hypothetical protein
MIKNNTIEKGCLYKVMEFWNNDYTIFCPKLTRNVQQYDNHRYITYMFAIYGYGKSAHILTQEKGVQRVVRVINGRYVKRLTAKDYLKVSRLLKSKGYRYDKKTKKLVNLNP